MIKALAIDNGIANRLEILGGDSQQIRFGKEFDTVISETIGNLGFDEQIVPILLDARERFLKSGGWLIFTSLTLLAAGAQQPSLLPMATMSFRPDCGRNKGALRFCPVNHLATLSIA